MPRITYQRRWLSLLSLALLLVSVACAKGATAPAPATPLPTASVSEAISLPNAARIDAYLSDLANTGNLNGSVLLAHNGRVFSKGYGLANKEANIPNTAQTMFRIGSNSKQFTSMAILILQERGKLHIHDSICLYLVSCPQIWQPITIQQLLFHSSGIPDYTDAPDFLSYWTQSITPEQLIARFKDLPLAFTPGSLFRYSNSNYILLGAIIEHVSGQSYSTFLQQNIFNPLGLHHTGYDSKEIRPNHATGYYKGFVLPDAYDMSWAYAAGALYSDVGDLFTWDQAIISHKLVSRQSIEDMLSVHIPCPPPGSPNGCIQSADQGYGYGLFIANEPQGRLIYHEGYIDGFLTLTGFYPDRDIQVAVLTNLEGADVLKIARTLASMV